MCAVLEAQKTTRRFPSQPKIRTNFMFHHTNDCICAPNKRNDWKQGLALCSLFSVSWIVQLTTIYSFVVLFVVTLRSSSTKHKRHVHHCISSFMNMRIVFGFSLEPKRIYKETRSRWIPTTTKKAHKQKWHCLIFLGSPNVGLK